ncbi:centromere protein L [Cricetulus griseus]
MDPYDSQGSTSRRRTSNLKDYFVGATPLQKRLESIRRQSSFFPSPPRRKIPQVGVRGTQRDPEAFLVQILSKSQSSREHREGRVLWTGWFCCVFGESLLETVSEDFTCLPLFLANGAESNTSLIGGWFQKTFDCCFSPLAISISEFTYQPQDWFVSRHL